MKKVFAIFFAVLMLTANVGLTYATHYCAGIAVKSGLMLGQHDLSCGMNMTETPCKEEESSSSLMNKSCCADEYLQLKIEGEYTAPLTVKAPVDFVWTQLLATVYTLVYAEVAAQKTIYTYYSPPLLKPDIPVLLQSFLL